MGDVLKFPEPPPKEPGNGALEVVSDYLSRVHPARVMARAMLGQDEEFDGDDVLPDPDHLLTWLWARGFKVVPVDG